MFWYEKIDVWKRSWKGRQKVRPPEEVGGHFGDNFPQKIDTQIYAEIDAEKVSKIEETTMRKWIYILKMFGIIFHENELSEKGECTKTTVLLQ